MDSINARADSRIWRLLVGLSWVALVIGITTAIITERGSLLALSAAVVAGIWVLLISAVPESVSKKAFVLDAMALGGAILTVTAMALTGAATSPYVILSFMPTMVAGSMSGLRLGIGTAGLTAGLLIAVSLSQESEVPPLGIGVLYVMVGFAVAQIRKLLRDAEARASSLEESSATNIRRLDALEDANRLLAQLTELTASAETSPIEMGRAALDSLHSRYPQAQLTAAINGENGPIVVARVGTRNSEYHEARIDLRIGHQTVGYVRIATEDPLSEEVIADASIGLEPLALAFSNVLLLQELTVSAVRAERTRLARELHDEIGPDLASLGLALDVALFQGAERRELTDHLQELRLQVGSIVEEVRTTVSDLRSSRLSSLRSHITSIGTQNDTEIDVEMLDERRPVRPSLAEAVHAICAEAVRNSINHARGKGPQIRGWVDFDRGRIVIADEGPGFDVEADYAGHYGLVGMRERAEAAGLHLDIVSSETGTQIVLEWGAQ